MDRGNRASPASVTDRYKVLLDVGRILTAAQKPEQLYATILQQSKRVLEMAGFAIATYDESSDSATVVVHAEGDQTRDSSIRFRGTDSVVIRSRKPILSDDPVHAIPPAVGRPGKFSVLSAPLVHDEQVLGAMCAYSFADHAYDAEDLELFSAIADLAAVTLSNVRYLEERERRQHEAERLEEIGRALTSSLDLPKVLERIVQVAVDLTAADFATVWLVRGDNEVEVVMTAGDLAPPRGLIVPIPPEMREVARTRHTFVLDSIHDTGANLPEYLRTETAAASTMAVSLVAENSLLGALAIGHREKRTYREHELRVLERLSSAAAIAVANARLHEQIFALSLTDALTGLPNRRHVEMFLEREFAAARRGRKLTVMLYDLDNFKDYNDQAGHEAGDEALRAFARVLTQQTRAMNLAARFGGDEFISVLADTDRRGGFTHATRVARAIAQDPLLTAAGIRASTGIATFSLRMSMPADLIRAADRDLYARKAGRGREIRA